MFKGGVMLCLAIFLVCLGTAVWAQEKFLDSNQIILDSNRVISERMVIRINPSWKIDSCKASPDDQRFACVVSSGRKGAAFVDGKKVMGDTCFVIVDGKKEKRYDDISKSSLTFSPDDEHFAYVAIYIDYKKGNNWLVVLDGVEEKWYHNINELSLTFSPDSKHLAYVARLFDKWFVVIDGKRGMAYDEIIPIRGKMVTFDSTGGFHYLGRKQNKIYLVDEEIK